MAENCVVVQRCGVNRCVLLDLRFCLFSSHSFFFISFLFLLFYILSDSILQLPTPAALYQQVH